MKKSALSKAAKLTVSLVLVLTLVIGAAAVFPVGLTAYAGYGGGSFGGFTWSLDGSELLEITGAAEDMPDFSNASDAPWNEYAGLINSVRVSAPIKSIGSRAFADCTALETAYIPGTVEKIGDYAFSGCSNLKTVYFPGSAEQWTAMAVGTGNQALKDAEIVAGDNRCGEDAVWSLSEYGTLTVSGTGKMWDFSGADALPWADSIDKIRDVVIENGITVIGKCSFASCSHLTVVSIGDTVSIISELAFCDCDSLESITIPACVQHIDPQAFLSCDLLETIYVSGENPYFSSQDGVLFSADKTSLLCYPPAAEGSVYIIPSGVKTIGDYAFYSCPGLKRVSIPGTVESIGSFAFYSCDNLGKVFYEGTETEYSSITVGAGNNSLNEADKYYSAALSNYLGSCGNYLSWELDTEGNLRIFGMANGDSYDMWDYSGMPAPWYDYRDQIETLEISPGVTSIGPNAFYNCGSLVSVTMADSIKSIGSTAFRNCTGLVSVVLPKELQDISDDSFFNCSSLGSIYISDECENYTTINGVLMSGDRTRLIIYPPNGDKQYAVPDKVTRITKNSFAVSAIREIYIPVSVTVIENGAFAYCDKLEKVHYAGTTDQWDDISIGTNNDKLIDAVLLTGESPRFGSCGDNMEWYFSEDMTLSINGIGNMWDWYTSDAPWAQYASLVKTISIIGEPKSIGAFAFKGCDSAKLVIIPDSVRSIGDGAFQDCGCLASITLPPDLSDLGKLVFKGCSVLTEIKKADGSASFHSVDGVLTDSGEKTIICFPPGRTGSYTIPSGVTSVADNAFDGASISRIAVPLSVTVIGEDAFSGCSSLTDVDYDGTEAQWKEITVGSGNEPLTGADIHFKAEAPAASGKCGDSLSWSLSTDGTLTISGTGTMYGYSSEIHSPWYDSRDKIKKIVIGDGVTDIGSFAFDGCDKAVSADIPVSVSEVGKNAFNGCGSLASVNYAGSADQWNNIKIGSGNEKLTGASVNCAVSSVPITSGKCGDSLSWSLSDEGTLTISGTGTMYDYSSEIHAPWYDSRDKIKKIVVSDGATDIGPFAFDGCDKAASADIPVSVSEVGKNAFNGCGSLANVNYAGSAEQWDNIKIGSGNEKLTGASVNCAVAPVPITSGKCGEDLSWSLSEDGTLTISGTGDMYGYSSEIHAPWYDSRDKIKKIVIGDGAADIGTYSFDGCSGAESVSIPASVTDIGKNAFKDCGSINEVLYGGTRNQWEDANIGSGNENLTGAPTGYNGNPPASHTPGDINGDGAVNNKDLIRLMKNLSANNVSDMIQDINGDGTVNNKDLIRLMRYIAGDSVEIH